MDGDPRRGSGYEVGACVDLGAFRRDDPDRGVKRWLSAARRVDWVVLMEDRDPDFFLDFRPGREDADVPLNRHGPFRDAWTVADVRDLVRHLHRRGVKVLLGAWMHECAWVDDRHPELLMRDAHGRLWQDKAARSADINPMKRLRADPSRGIEEGLPFTTYVARQYEALRATFDLDGLFVGDGGMGFREFAKDAHDALWFDFDPAWVREFASTAACAPHEGCALAGDDAAASAADVRAHHAEAWLAWTRAKWASFYRELADVVHATGGTLAAYNVMNYDPVLAREHGVDYRDLAEAGLDVLVFQTYDWAWGPHGPLDPVPHKDAATNQLALLLTRGHVGHDTGMRIVFTTETNDSVEGWKAPVDRTVEEIAAYAGARSYDGDRWRPVADGTLVVWANDVPAPEWIALEAAWNDAFAHAEPPRKGVVVYAHAAEPHDPGSYAHLHATLAVTGKAPDGVARVRAPEAPGAVPIAPVRRRPTRP